MRLRLATLQRLTVLAALVLAVGFFAVLQPLSRSVRDRETPIRELRQQLSQATREAGLPDETPFDSLDELLAALRGAVIRFAAAEREAQLRLEHPDEVRRYLDQPFQLVEFLNESQRRLEELAALAQSDRVTLTPGLPRGFPRYLPELVRPELLWIQLATVNRLVRTAIRVGVREVSEVSVEPLPAFETDEFGPLPLPIPAPSSPTNAWSTLRVHLTVSGTVDALAQLLLALALTPEELQPSGLPEGLGAQPALFIDHLLMRRTELETPEQVRLELVVSTVVPSARP